MARAFKGTVRISKKKKKTAGDIVRASRKRAKKTGGDPNQIAGRIAKQTIKNRKGKMEASSSPRKSTAPKLGSPSPGRAGFNAPKPVVKSNIPKKNEGFPRSFKELKTNIMTPISEKVPEGTVGKSVGLAGLTGAGKLGAKALQAATKAKTFQGVKKALGMKPSKWIPAKTMKEIQANQQKVLGIIETTGKSRVETMLSKFKPIKRAALRTQTNPKTTKLTKGILGKIFPIKTTEDKIKTTMKLSLIGSMIGTYPWAEWAAGEAKEIHGFIDDDVMATKDPQLIQEWIELGEDLSKNNAWESIARVIPGANIGKGFMEKGKSLRLQFKVGTMRAKEMQDHIGELQQAEEAGQPLPYNPDDGEYWIQKDKNKAELKKEAREYDKTRDAEILERKKAEVDYFNELQIRTQERIAKAKKEDDKESMEMWMQNQKEILKLKDEAMREQGEFWMEYNKQMEKQRANNSPSKLNFGLL